MNSSNRQNACYVKKQGWVQEIVPSKPRTNQNKRSG